MTIIKVDNMTTPSISYFTVILIALFAIIIAVPTSCAALLSAQPGSTSGEYTIVDASGTPRVVYCDMTRSCGGVTGGWTRIAYLNMKDSSETCPLALSTHSFSSGVRACIAAEADTGTCSHVVYPSTISYSKVCGSIQSYYGESLDAFNDFGRGPDVPLSGNYVDGVSLTQHGVTDHIWTLAANRCGFDCGVVPSYVENNYFCDAGIESSVNLGDDDLMWDGVCGTATSHCSGCDSGPWFSRDDLVQSDSDITMRFVG